MIDNIVLPLIGLVTIIISIVAIELHYGVLVL
jgi:hypothetical protein